MLEGRIISMKNLNGGILLIGFCSFLLACGGCASNLKLTVEDSIGRPGEKARLTARLWSMEATVLNQQPEKRDLEFYLDGLLIGMKETGQGGYTSIGYRAKKVGLQRVTVMYIARTNKVQATGRLFVWNPNDRILLVELDGIAGQKNKAGDILPALDVSAPVAGAPEALRELANQYHIVYLTNHSRDDLPQARGWLEKNDFPAGPVLIWDIEKIQTDFSGARIGIANTDRAYQAYRERKIFSILLDPKQPAGQIESGLRVPDWNAVPGIFKNRPSFKN
jgi:hypothetical protein